jgi:hypothetical protein
MLRHPAGRPRLTRLPPADRGRYRVRHQQFRRGAHLVGSYRRIAAVTPDPRRAGTEWVLAATLPNGDATDIGGFRTASEAHEWLGSARHMMWLRQNRVGPGAGFRAILACASALALAALPLIERAVRNAVDLAARTQRGLLARLRAAGLDPLPAAEAMRERWSSATRVASTLRPPAVRWRRLIVAGALLTVAVLVLGRGRAEPPVGSEAVAAQGVVKGPRLDRSSIGAADIPDEIALLLDRLSAKLAAEPVAPQPEIRDEPYVEPQAVPPPWSAPRPPIRPAIVGVWVPEPGSCPARDSHEGLLKALISTRGAHAGGTSCTFTKREQSDGEWRMLARCSNGHERWTTSIRLTVQGNRLIWTSKRGTQAYVRCRSA